MPIRSVLAFLALLGAGALLTWCAGVPLTAAPGSTIFLQASPPFVIANGGRSVVTAMLTEPAGTFVPDGTQVFFFTDIGRIDDMVKTRNGVARANFVSDSRSGVATVTAYSGGPAPSAPTTPTSTTATTTPATAAATGTGTASITIAIGSALAAKVVVVASPPVLASSRTALITANVYDGNGNPVRNVPVIFSVEAVGSFVVQETLESGGTPQYTDSNGQAFDMLRTRAPNGTTQKAVSVRATVPGTAATEKVTVYVNYDSTV